MLSGIKTRNTDFTVRPRAYWRERTEDKGEQDTPKQKEQEPQHRRLQDKRDEDLMEEKEPEKGACCCSVSVSPTYLEKREYNEECECRHSNLCTDARTVDGNTAEIKGCARCR